MENLTHSLVGATLAELALPVAATKGQRRAFFIAGVVASNLPDADLLYSNIMPAPLGYLLHHRGHTHTLAGVVGLALLVAVVALSRSVRHTIAPVRAQFWALVIVSLLGHLVLDSWNSYGVHALYPFTGRWFYGDAISIVEPWLWVLLGVAAVANTQHRYGRIGLALLLVAGSLGLARIGWLSITTIVALGVGVVVVVWVVARMSPVGRSWLALGMTAVFVAGMFVTSRVARGEVLAAFPPSPGGRIVDVILSPAAAVPQSWTFIAIEVQEAADAYVMRRGTLVLGPSWMHRAASPTRGSVLEWRETRQSLSRLRALSRDDCWVWAWLQFGRAPVLTDSDISDLRFGGSSPGNFTDMRLKTGAAARQCPPYVTPWAMPRADLVSGR